MCLYQSSFQPGLIRYFKLNTQPVCANSKKNRVGLYSTSLTWIYKDQYHLVSTIMQSLEALVCHTKCVPNKNVMHRYVYIDAFQLIYVRVRVHICVQLFMQRNFVKYPSIIHVATLSGRLHSLFHNETTSNNDGRFTNVIDLLSNCYPMDSDKQLIIMIFAAKIWIFMNSCAFRCFVLGGNYLSILLHQFMLLIKQLMFV